MRSWRCNDIPSRTRVFLAGDRWTNTRSRSPSSMLMRHGDGELAVTMTHKRVLRSCRLECFGERQQKLHFFGCARRQASVLRGAQLDSWVNGSGEEPQCRCRGHRLQLGARRRIALCAAGEAPHTARCFVHIVDRLRRQTSSYQHRCCDRTLLRPGPGPG